MEIVSWILSALVGMVIGYIVAAVVAKKITNQKAEKLVEEAKIEAEVIKKDKILQAKEKFLQLKEEHEKVIGERERKMADLENRSNQKEKSLNSRLQELNRKERDVDAIKRNLSNQLELLDKKQAEAETYLAKQIEKLESVSGISAADAKSELRETLTAEARTEAMANIKEVTDEAKLTANKEAKKIVIQSIQRLATEQAIENAVTVFNIEGDDMKGRIIGREGRNIRALEAATGVEIIVDDTPDAIILSCFDPARREVARLSLHQLISDGRIHPARIEDVVRKMSKQLNEEMIETGKRTCIDLNIHGVHPELMRVIGKMKYRSSYGQNLLQHSREVANLSATMAAELGLDAKLAKRAGLLHDIGKVPDEEPELPHAILGMKWAEKYKENAEVCNAIGAHHDEIEMTSMISPIVQVCDGISGARPGARRQIVESYINRIKELESLGLSYKGVSQAFAIQAGRELRVIVESEKISDKEADVLSFDLAQKIQTEMTYPGQVKVTVIREKRAVNVAK